MLIPANLHVKTEIKALKNQKMSYFSFSEVYSID